MDKPAFPYDILLFHFAASVQLSCLGKKMKRLFCVLLMVCLPLLSSCGSWQQGFYESSIGNSAVWKRTESEGISFFSWAALRKNDGYISFSTPEKGKLFMAVYFGGHTVDIADRFIRIVSRDGHEVREERLEYSATLDVPSEFVVEIPAFVLDGVSTQPLRVEFAWTDRRFYRSVGAW